MSRSPVPGRIARVIIRTLKGLEDVVSLSVVEPLYGPHGWRFGDSPGTIADSVNGASELAEIYLRADPRYSGRVSVPVLWDKERATIVNNELSEIIRMFNGAFGRFTNVRTDYYPAQLRDEIDRVNAFVYENINNGVYRAGFATSQEAYEEAFRALFAALDDIEQRLARQRYLVGPEITEADWRLFTTLRALRCGLLRPLQMQSAPHRRLSQSFELPARPLPAARHRRDREHGPHQAALLRQPAQREPDRHRAARAAARFPGAARPQPIWRLTTPDLRGLARSGQTLDQPVEEFPAVVDRLHADLLVASMHAVVAGIAEQAGNAVGGNAGVAQPSAVGIARRTWRR